MALDPKARPQSVFALQNELNRTAQRRYTPLTLAEKMRIKWDALVSRLARPFTGDALPGGKPT
jgi:hypothetical protein